MNEYVVENMLVSKIHVGARRERVEGVSRRRSVVMDAENLIFVDLETGGLEPQHPTIQVAAVAVGPGWQEMEAMEVKLAFDPAECDAEALSLNSYDAETWERDAVSPTNAVQCLHNFFERRGSWKLISKRGKPYTTARIAGHNAARFDAPRLKALWGDRYTPFAWWYPLDTLQLALWHFAEPGNAPAPTNYQLETLCKHFNLGWSSRAHDALEDVRATVQLARALRGSLR